jgi:hypothetical protein
MEDTPVGIPCEIHPEDTPEDTPRPRRKPLEDTRENTPRRKPLEDTLAQYAEINPWRAFQDVRLKDTCIMLFIKNFYQL